MLAMGIVYLLCIFTYHTQASEFLIRDSQGVPAGARGSPDGAQNLLTNLQFTLEQKTPALPEVSLKLGLSSTPEPTSLELGLGQDLSRPNSQTSVFKPWETNHDHQQALTLISASSQRQTHATPENFPKWLRGCNNHQLLPESSMAGNYFVPLEVLPNTALTPISERANCKSGMGNTSTCQKTQTVNSKQQHLDSAGNLVSTGASSSTFTRKKNTQARSRQGILYHHFPYEFPAANGAVDFSRVSLDGTSLTQRTLGKLTSGNNQVRKDTHTAELEEWKMNHEDRATLAKVSSVPQALEREALSRSQKSISGSMERWRRESSYYHFKHEVPLEILLSDRMAEDRSHDMEIIYEDSSSASGDDGLSAAEHERLGANGDEANSIKSKKIIQKFYPEEKILRKQRIEDKKRRVVPFKFRSKFNKGTFEKIQRQFLKIKEIEYGDEIRYQPSSETPGVRYRKIWREAHQKGSSEMKELNLGPKIQPDSPLMLLRESKKRKPLFNPPGQRFQNAKATIQHVLPCVIHDIRVLFEAFPEIAAKKPLKEIQREAWEFYKHFWHRIEAIYTRKNGEVPWESQSLMSHQDFVRLIDVIDAHCLNMGTRDSLSMARRLLLLWMSCKCQALYPFAIKRANDEILLNIVGVLNEFYNL